MFTDLGVSIALACVLLGCGMAWGQQAEYESFEDGVPACFAATRAASPKSRENLTPVKAAGR